MKKTYLSALAALLALAVIITGCAPVVGQLDYLLGNGDQAAETAVFTAVTTKKQQAVDTQALADSGDGNITAADVVGTIVNTTGQRVYIDFNYEIDAATVAGAVTFYPLSNATDNFTVYVRGTPLAYTATVEGMRVYFTINATGASAQIEMEINAATLTGKNGTQKLDTDGDSVQGEAEDTVVAYLPVGINSAAGATAPTALTIGVQRFPRAALTVTETGLLAAGDSVVDIATYTTGNLWTFTVNDTGSSATPYLINVATAASVYKMVAGAWALAASTTTYATGTATISLTTAPVAGETYKVVVDNYNVFESTAVRGYVHRASYDQTDDGGARYSETYYTFVNAGGAQQVVTVAGGGSNFARYIDVTLSGTVPIDLTTITPTSLVVILSAGTTLATGATTEDYLVSYSVTPLETDSYNTIDNAVFSFRIWMPAQIRAFVGAANSVYISSSVRAKDHSTLAAEQKLNFGDVTTEGWQIVTF